MTANGGDGVGLSESLDNVGPQRTSCDDGDHAGCTHIPYFSAVRVFPIVDLRFLDLDDTDDLTLCRCVCHQECSMQLRADGTGWPEGCSCNGTLKLRHQFGRHAALPQPTNIVTTGRAAIELNQRKRAAAQAVAARAAGQDNDQVGRILDEEWARQGLERPVGFTRELLISGLMNPRSGTERAVSTAKAFADLATAPGRLRSLWRQAKHAEQQEEAEQTYRVASDNKLVEVVVNEVTRPRLSETQAGGFQLFSSIGRGFDVELRQPSERVEVWCGPPASAWHLGTLAPGDTGPFQRAIRVATRVQQRCLCHAVAVRGRDQRWRVGLALPLLAEG